MYNYKYVQTYSSSSAMIFLLMVSLAVGGVIIMSPIADNPSMDTKEPTVSNGIMNFMMERQEESIPTLVYTTSYDYSELVSAIENSGGTVSFQYRYAMGIAAEIPRRAIFDISQMPMVERIELDEQREPQSLDRESMAQLDVELTTRSFELSDYDFQPLDITAVELQSLRAELSPENYGNQEAHEVDQIWEAGNFGQDNLIVVIDTGIYKDHSMFLPGQVIGGVDLSYDVGTPFEDPFSVDNHYHGTHVAGTAAGNGAYLFASDSLLVQSMLYHGFDLIDGADIGFPGYHLVTLFGNAPDASLYAIKVFDHTGGSAANSIIIAGIEHAIAMHESGEEDVDVINMSLGGGSGYEGRDLESQVIDYGTSIGITFVVSAGNDGPSSMTIGTPAGTNSAISTGAALTPEHTRVFWDFNYGSVGIGDLLFTPQDTQMMYFSSRGPTSDGRAKPTASTVGVYVLSSATGSPTSLAFASGTSMAAPNLAGIVALLNTYGETVGASPYDYKQAVIAGSTPLPGYEDWEQGAGFVSAYDSMSALLEDNKLGEAHPDLRWWHSRTAVHPYGTHINFDDDHNKDNKHKFKYDFEWWNDDEDVSTYEFSIEDLTPGHVRHYWFKATPSMEKLTIDVSNVDLGIDPILFNSFEVHVMSPIRTSDIGYHLYSVNVWDDAHLEVSDLASSATGAVFGVNAAALPLMNGYFRISIENDWTSYDDLSGDFEITLYESDDHERDWDEKYKGWIQTGQTDGFFEVGHGTSGVEIELSWLRDWRFYPASDLEVIVAWYNTTGHLHWDYSGATFSSPEKVRIESANIDSVFVLVDGYETYDNWERWTLKVTYLN